MIFFPKSFFANWRPKQQSAMGCIPSSNTLAALPEGLLHSFESYELFVGESKAGERWKTPLYFCTRCIKTKPKAVPCLRFWCVFSGVFHRFLLLICGKNLSSHCWRCIPALTAWRGTCRNQTKFFCLFWAICGILIQLLSWSSPRHTRRTPKYIVDMYICISYVYIYIYTHWHRRHESIMNTMFVIVYDCILNYVTACDCIHSFSSFPVVHKAKMPTLGMLMLDQKTSKKELGGFDHPGQAQRYETWVFNMNVQKDGKVKDVHLAVESDCHWVIVFIWQAVSAISWNRKWWKDWRWIFVILENWHLSWRNPSPVAFLPWKCLGGPNTRRRLEVAKFYGETSVSNWGSRSFGDLWRHGFHDVVSILGAEKHQVTSDSQLMLEGKACNSM